jgi:uncharacterized Zn-binding protein involved in type VI secretion
MHKQAARDGDPTTTGGRVQAWHGADFDSDGKRVAFTGSVASCGECEGMFQVIASYDGWTHGGRKMALDSDRVACPCGKNRIIAHGTNILIEDVSQNSANAATWTSSGSPSSFIASQVRTYDEGIVLFDASSGEPLAGYRYRIATDSGKTLEGVTDQSGRTQRITTELAERFRLQIQGKQDGR